MYNCKVALLMYDNLVRNVATVLEIVTKENMTQGPCVWGKHLWSQHPWLDLSGLSVLVSSHSLANCSQLGCWDYFTRLCLDQMLKFVHKQVCLVLCSPFLSGTCQFICLVIPSHRAEITPAGVLPWVLLLLSLLRFLEFFYKDSWSCLWMLELCRHDVKGGTAP